MLFYNQNYIVAEQVRAKQSVDDFLNSEPSIIEIQAYVQIARNDLLANPQDIYTKEVIRLLSGE